MLWRIDLFVDVWNRRQPSSRARALMTFVRFFEDKTQTHVVYAKDLPRVRDSFGDLWTIAQRLMSAGVISYYLPRKSLPDEPRLFAWVCAVKQGTGTELYSETGGGSLVSERQAMTAALAEAVERYVWLNSRDHFKNHKILSSQEVFSDYYRRPAELFGRVSSEVDVKEEYMGVEGYSWTSSRRVSVPVSLVSGVAFAPEEKIGPRLRESITSGLATWPTRTGAVRRGMLELFERDAYMIMWFNQLSLPRYKHEDLSLLSSDLAKLIAVCLRYRFTPNFVRLMTDAPTHAIMVVLKDDTGAKPQVSIGLKAHSSLASAAEGALLEALRMRNVTCGLLKKNRDSETNIGTYNVGHTDRLVYWTREENVSKLSFLTQGPLCPVKSEVWESDDDLAHFNRMLSWCKDKKYECTSVSLTKAKANVTPWHIEVVVVPNLQWMHLHEKSVQVNEKRRTEVPRQFGYESRSEAFLTEPHPFA